MTNISAVSTRARSARSPVNESTVSTPGVDTSNNNEQHTQAGPVVNKDAELNNGFSSKAMDFVQRRQAVIRFVQDAIAASVDRQKLNADNNGIRNSNEFKVGSLVLLATQNLAKHAVSDFGASKLAPRFIGPFTVLAKHGNAYTLDIPSSMRLKPEINFGHKVHHDGAPFTTLEVVTHFVVDKCKRNSGRTLGVHQKRLAQGQSTINNNDDDREESEDEEIRPGAVPRGLKKIIDVMYVDINDPDIATDDYFANRTILTTTNTSLQGATDRQARHCTSCID
ncbi:unnamed protein product [Phytophthora fragariaefolia]|uniref:Unnamed protein product n=1 Tax=Phytophthora fragariaefolia TaxID=1490495 RepID=A0A9W6YGD8_9STRA|nr:unnamed protein product [Phytophthora fragariaefolia]